MGTAIHAFTCGYLTMPYASFLAGEEGVLTVPVPAYLVTHDKGWVLFDTGFNPRAADTASGYCDRLHHSNKVQVRPIELLNARLEAAGFDPRRVTHLVNSHLHYDHAGGNQLAPDIPVIVQQRELNHARRKDPHAGYVAEDYETGQCFTLIDGVYDIFGDGSIVCMPTFGHTPGHQSLRVTGDGGVAVLAGDACYLRRTLDHMHLPRFCHDRGQMRASLRALQELQRRGARILYGHDPDFWHTVPQAPARVL